jgi:hypothetical protein
LPTFIIDCPICRAKVGVVETGSAERTGFDDDAHEPYGDKIVVGLCPSCKTPLAGITQQTHFEGWQGDEFNGWSDIIRVHPKPPKTFSSYRIPRSVTSSLLEADKTLQASAYLATCVMFGRAFEALCRDILEKHAPDMLKKRMMLGAGIKALKEKNIIDQSLYDWSQQLQAFRNLAAHAEDITISREDAEDLQAFMHAITEYIYDLTDRYEEFKERAELRKKPRPSAAEMFKSLLPKPPDPA